tara:strand:+ start:664 stop:876 length:213 start_codon:yes stop_codon:yes gene_type:complete
MVKKTHENGVDRDMTPEEESASNALIAKWKTEDDAKDAVEAQKVTDKASAKAKLMAGEALTEAEADTIVL